MDLTFDYDAELRRYHQRLQAAMDVRPDDHVLDIGCGTGLTTREAAKAATSGSALGVDISAQMVETARQLSEREGLRNVSFEQADAQLHPFPARRFSLATSRFGTMFFTDPGVAFTNIARALRPGARLVQLVWQDAKHQEWHTAIRDALAGGRTLPVAAAYGAFSLADPVTAEHLLTAAGFADLQITDVREPVYYGPDAEAALNAARSLMVTKDLLADLDPAQTEDALQRLRATLTTHHTADGIWFDSRAWIITAHTSAHA
ncbi:MAG TPA: methyltransferase domain-containing protein [Kribbella sp.]|uniref:class I SAM-dependent methyltransferase n=1 Tax=Kribbella sp. TaxID=1871183 RepID=UPI002D792ECC|nr:methyltransferase domain-containing protein [Kribbella sp.]HET6295217.1 methyltransferase domain-containing protein [Kribbella sp.]